MFKTKKIVKATFLFKFQEIIQYKQTPKNGKIFQPSDLEPFNIKSDFHVIFSVPINRYTFLSIFNK